MTKLLKFICSRYSHVFSENKRTEKAAGSTVGKHGLITDNTDWVMDSCSKKKTHQGKCEEERLRSDMRPLGVEK